MRFSMRSNRLHTDLLLSSDSLVNVFSLSRMNDHEENANIDQLVRTHLVVRWLSLSIVLTIGRNVYGFVRLLCSFCQMGSRAYHRIYIGQP